MPPAFVENPPSYEDAMRQTSTDYSTGIANMVSIQSIKNTHSQVVFKIQYTVSYKLRIWVSLNINRGD